MEKVRCADCGFLAVRDKETRQLVETEIEMRQTWVIPKRPNEPVALPVYERDPLCFAQAADIGAEIHKIPGRDTAWTRVILSIIVQPRECAAFTKWRHGFTPREHQEMLIQDDLRKQSEEQRQRDLKFQQEQRKADRDWQEKQARANREWQENWNRKNAYRAWILAIVGVVGGIVGYWIKSIADQPSQREPVQPQIIIQQVPAESKEKSAD